MKWYPDRQSYVKGGPVDQEGPVLIVSIAFLFLIRPPNYRTANERLFRTPLTAWPTCFASQPTKGFHSDARSVFHSNGGPCSNLADEML